jgi:glycosyltransferase involved in cell wall biosynthesis
MRILFCNKYNHPFSGTEVYLFELMQLLRDHGHEVALFSMCDPKGQTTPYDQYFVPHVEFKSESEIWTKPRLALRAIYSWEARRRIRAMIQEFRPDVAHVRNIYHHLTPSILWELKAQGIPVIYHLNDFKLLCSSYNLVSNGDACEACRGGAFYHVVGTNCYPGRGARIALAAEAYFHRWLHTYRKCVDLFLAPSSFVRDKFVEHGWDASRFEVLGHFQELHPLDDSPPAEDAPVLYCGRLSAEKGVHDLLQAMRQLSHLRLVIAGDGPQQEELMRLSASLRLDNVTFAGRVAARERDTLIRQSRFTVFPSHAYETFGKTILESYGQARTVIATDQGSRRELVMQGETGILYRTGDVNHLAHAMSDLAANPNLAGKMGRAGWHLVRKHHSPEEHYTKLVGFYEDLVARSHNHRVLESQSHAGKISALQYAANKEPRPIALPPRLRIAFIGGRGVISKYSGIETYYEEVGSRLAEMGHEVTIYCRNYFTPDVAEYRGMRLVRLPTIRSKHLETAIHTLLSTAHAVTQRYDIVHYHALGPSLLSFIPRLIGTKTAVTVQGLDWRRKKWGRIAASVLRLGEWASACLPNQTMTVSRVLQDRYCKLHGIEAAYVPNGGILRPRSETRMIPQWGLEAGQYILYLGRFSPEKGCHLLIEAFEQIESQVKLVMAGGSSYSDAYSRELRAHAGERIRMLDWVSGDALDELLTNAMIFVLPSDMEGLSLALLDAMGAGLCVLTSDVPENRELVDGSGFTFRAGNAADLADRMRFLISNPAVREAAGRTARQRIAEQYQWPQIARQIEKSYFQALGRHSPESDARKPNLAVNPAENLSGAERRAG